MFHMEQSDPVQITTKETGKLGEDVASQWLINNGFEVIERNYLKKWGEIDIVSRRTDRIHFIEVKAVSYETKAHLEYSVTRGTFRPEELVHGAKLHKLANTIETWISEHSFTGNYQLDVITVRMVPREKFAAVDVIENVNVE